MSTERDRQELVRLIADGLRADSEGFGSCNFPRDLADSILGQFNLTKTEGVQK